MEKYARPVAIGTAIGTLAVILYFAASQLPAAIADEPPLDTLMKSANELMPPRGFDPDTLVKFGDASYSIAVDADVSLTPLSTRTVRKIAFGQMTTVTISTTSSGVYSSEAMFSPHIRYPGIEVRKVVPDVMTDDMRFAYWREGEGWAALPALGAGSFLIAVPRG